MCVTIGWSIIVWELQFSCCSDTGKWWGQEWCELHCEVRLEGLRRCRRCKEGSKLKVWNGNLLQTGNKTVVKVFMGRWFFSGSNYIDSWWERVFNFLVVCEESAKTKQWGVWDRNPNDPSSGNHPLHCRVFFGRGKRFRFPCCLLTPACRGEGRQESFANRKQPRLIPILWFFVVFSIIWNGGRKIQNQ